MIDFTKPVLISSPSSNFAHGGNNGGNVNSNHPYTYPYQQPNDIFRTNQENSLGHQYNSYVSSKYYADRNTNGRGRSLDMEVVDVKPDFDIGNKPSSSFGHRLGQLSGTTGNAKSQQQPIEGSFYEWRKIMSDCSVICGTGK